MSVDGSEGLLSGESPSNAELLLGDAGKNFVQTKLQTVGPAEAIAEIQSRGAIQDGRCRPLLGLLDHLGVSRAEAHREVMKRAIDALLKRIPSLPQDTLLRLLEETFFYVGIAELRAVPLAVLQRLHPVPKNFLQQLASDRDLFWELPTQVQRQIWEQNRKLLQSQALSLVAAYTYETATWMSGLDIDATLPDNFECYHFYQSLSNEQNKGKNAIVSGDISPGDASTISPSTRKGMPQLNRRSLRNGSAALRRLVSMVGSSAVLYRGIVDICVAQYRDSDSDYVGMKEAALCALRSQLLMALHDAEEVTICATEPCYKLVWILDACLREHDITPIHIKEIRKIMKPYETSELRKQSRKSHVTGNRRSRSTGGQKVVISTASETASGTGTFGSAIFDQGFDNDAESAGVPGAATAVDDPSRHLGAAGMVLRDPAACHLLLHRILRTLENCVRKQNVPSQDKDLIFLTRLLSLAVEVRSMLRERTFFFPDASSDILTKLYPSIASLILETELREVDEPLGPGSEEEEKILSGTTATSELVQMLEQNEISRRIVQVYVLERLAKGDLLSAQPALASIARSLTNLSNEVISEFAPFAFTLARRMTVLFASGRVKTSSAAWRMAVDAILIRLVDSETEVHEEVLRLLLSAVADLEPKRLGQCLVACLKNSQHSRNICRKRGIRISDLPPYNHGYLEPDRLYSGTSSFINEESECIGDQAGEDADFCGYAYEVDEDSKFKPSKNGDGVHTTYSLFLKYKPELSEEVAPELFKYLNSFGNGGYECK